MSLPNSDFNFKKIISNITKLREEINNYSNKDKQELRKKIDDIFNRLEDEEKDILNSIIQRLMNRNMLNSQVTPNVPVETASTQSPPPNSRNNNKTRKFFNPYPRYRNFTMRRTPKENFNIELMGLGENPHNSVNGTSTEPTEKATAEETQGEAENTPPPPSRKVLFGRHAHRNSPNLYLPAELKNSHSPNNKSRNLRKLLIRNPKKSTMRRTANKLQMTGKEKPTQTEMVELRSIKSGNGATAEEEIAQEEERARVEEEEAAAAAVEAERATAAVIAERKRAKQARAAAIAEARAAARAKRAREKQARAERAREKQARAEARAAESINLSAAAASQEPGKNTTSYKEYLGHQRNSILFPKSNNHFGLKQSNPLLHNSQTNALPNPSAAEAPQEKEKNTNLKNEYFEPNNPFPFELPNIKVPPIEKKETKHLFPFELPNTKVPPYKPRETNALPNPLSQTNPPVLKRNWGNLFTNTYKPPEKPKVKLPWNRLFSKNPREKKDNEII